jgi:hypothetical protein
MSSSLETKFTGDSKHLEAAYQKIQRENVKLREEAKKTAEEHKHAGEEGIDLGEKLSESIGEQVEELVKMGAEWLTVGKAIELVNEEYERQIELAEKAADTVRDTGAQRAPVLRNLGPVSGDERREFFEQLEKISLKRGLKEDEADQAVNFALSATGGNRDRALGLVDLAAQAAPEGGGDTVGQIARSIEQMRTVTKRDDDQANLGLLFSAQKISPIKEIENISNYAVPAAMGLTAQGASPEEAFALFSTLAKASGDVEGRRTRTAVTNLYGGLSKFFDPDAQAKRVRDQLAHQGSLQIGETPDAALQGRVGDFLKGHGFKSVPHDFKDQMQILKERPELGQQFVAEETGRLPSPKSVTDQIRALQQNDELRKQFFQEFSPEAQAKGADIELLRGGSETAKQFTAQTKELQATDYRQAAGHQIETIASEPAIQRLRQHKVSEVQEEQSFAGDFAKADRGTYRQALEKMLDSTQDYLLSSMGNWGTMKGFDYDTIIGQKDPAEEFNRRARGIIFNLKYDVPEGLKIGGDHRFARGEAGDAELLDAGIVPTQDAEHLRKAKIAQDALDEMNALRARESAAGAEAQATEEATPAETAKRIQQAKPTPPASGAAPPIPPAADKTGPAETAKQIQAAKPTPPAAGSTPPIPPAADKTGPAETAKQIQKAKPSQPPMPEGRTTAWVQEVGHEPQEVVPRFNMHDYDALYSASDKLGKRSGLLDPDLLGRVDHAPQASADDTSQLLQEAKQAKHDLETKGHFESGKWTDDDEAPTAADRRQAADLAPAIAVLEKILAETQRQTQEAAKKREQDAAHHRQAQAAGRQSDARAQGRKTSGRE